MGFNDGDIVMEHLGPASGTWIGIVVPTPPWVDRNISMGVCWFGLQEGPLGIFQNSVMRLGGASLYCPAGKLYG